MSHPKLRGAAVAALAAACIATAATARQAPPSAEPYVVQNVRIERAEDGRRATIVMRGGRIAAVLAPDAAIPPGVRVVDGAELLALPAFVDAYSRAGLTTPTPVADQDVPVDVAEDVRVDMRLANRKGIEPAFRAVDALAVDESLVEAWTDAGFGALLVAPGGQLLAGDSALATVREAAARDLVVAPDVHAHAAFAATGDGYPSTLMGYHAQLRQFFLDASRHAELERRYEQGRPGPRPPHDAELEAGEALLAGDRLLVCAAETSRDVERWLRLADELGVRIAISGGRDAWKVADRLAAARVPVVLTLDWGDEVDDPAAEKDGKKKEKKKDAEDAAWTYTEPLGVRAEKRREWEEKRDCALRLHEAGVAFAFGTGDRKPKELLESVRKAVEAGLPADVALDALTGGAARFAGAERHLGAIAPGMDATLTLWKGDPLADDKAEPAWVFVDGFAHERELKPAKERGKDGGGEGPAEGVTATGTWTLAIKSDQAPESARLVLEMADDGAVTGTYVVVMQGDESEADVEGRVEGDELTLSGVFDLGEAQIAFEFEATIDGDELSGTTSVELPWEPDTSESDFTGAREPGRKGGVR